MVSAELLESDRRVLWGLCYRMTGNAADADDLVQETFVRALERPPKRTDEPLRPWLLRVAINLSRDLLRKRKRRPYIGNWLPSPVPTAEFEVPASYEPVAAGEDSPSARYDLLESVTFAFLLALEALTPNQRAVLLLRDVFDYSTEETATALDLTETNVKVLLMRARKKMSQYDKQRLPVTPARSSSVRLALERFLEYLGRGDAAALEQLFVEDAISQQDGGGEVPAALRTIFGRSKVVRLIFGLAAKLPAKGQSRWVDVNGAPALLFEYPNRIPGLAPRFLLTCDIDDSGRIRSLHTVLAPGKLRSIQ